MVQIYDEDIDKNEKKFDIMFDRSRREVLKNMNSIDIVACAGSGKTTIALLRAINLANLLSISFNSISRVLFYR